MDGPISQRYLSGFLFLWCSSKHGTTHIGRLHCQYLYIIPPTPLPFDADGTISLFCTSIILPPYLSYEVALNQMGYRLSGKLSPSHSTTISNSCIISSTVYLSFEAIIAQALVFVCIRKMATCLALSLL